MENLKGKCVAADMSFRYRDDKVEFKSSLRHVIVLDVVAKWMPISAFGKINSQSLKNYSYS